MLEPDALRKLLAAVRLLGSPVEQEAVASARAVRRIMLGAGLTMHDLAAALERGIATTPVRQADLFEPTKRARLWREQAIWAWERRAVLNPRDVGFLRTILAYPMDRNISERQCFWLGNIIALLREQEAA